MTTKRPVPVQQRLVLWQVQGRFAAVEVCDFILSSANLLLAHDYLLDCSPAHLLKVAHLLSCSQAYTFWHVSADAACLCSCA